MGYEHTMPVSERAKTVHALDRAPSEIGAYPHIALVNSIPHTKATRTPAPSGGTVS
jgi:hypothetical protein